MSLDKFGRHIVKHGRRRNNDENLESSLFESRNASEFMFYNIILNFQSNKTESDFYVIKSTNRTHYYFPLKYAVVESVKSSFDDICILVNEERLSLSDVVNIPLYINDVISFPAHPTQTEMYVEIVIKCPIRFENYSVLSERPIQTQQQ